MLVGLVAMLLAMRLRYHALMRAEPAACSPPSSGSRWCWCPASAWSMNGARRWIQIGSLPPPALRVREARGAHLHGGVALGEGRNPPGLLAGRPSVRRHGRHRRRADHGSSLTSAPRVMIGLITGTLFFVAGARLFHVLVLGARPCSSHRGARRTPVATAWTASLVPLRRVDPTGVGFHALQLLVAFGSGGHTGPRARRLAPEVLLHPRLPHGRRARDHRRGARLHRRHAS
jgi:hypothetical protein